MYPTLLSIGIFRFHTYTVMMSVGFVLAALLAVRENYKLERPYPFTTMCALCAFVVALVGSRAWHIVQYTEESWRGLHKALLFWDGGLVFYGGLLGGLVGAIGYLKWFRIPLLPAGDIIMPFIPLGHAIARLGCFFNGCCWGAPTGLPWGICYPKRSVGAYAQHVDEGWIAKDAAHSLPVHPSTVYESLGLLCLFAFMRFAYKRQWHRNRPGAVLFLYPAGYGLLRFCVEMSRGDNVRSVLGQFTVSQMVAVFFMLVSLTGFTLLHTWYWPRCAAAAAVEAEEAVEPAETEPGDRTGESDLPE